MMPVMTIKLKLGAACGISRKRLHADLLHVARQCNRARNAMLEHWLLWRRANPDWAPQQRRARDGSPKLKQNGEPALEHPAVSQDVQNQLYHSGRAVAGDVNATAISHCSAGVVDRLKSNCPWDSGWKSKFVWQAILAHERSLDTYRGLAIPVPRKDSGIYYLGKFSNDAMKPGGAVLSRIVRFAGNSAVLRVPVWSQASGRRIKDAIIRIEIAKLSRGRRKLLARVAAGELRMADSKLVCKGPGEPWYLALSLDIPAQDHGHDKERVLTLSIGKDHSFVVTLPDGEQLSVGDDRPLLEESKRLLIRRRTIQTRSRHGNRRGHGKKGFYSGLRPSSRRFVDMQREFRNQLVAAIVRLCVRHDCGTVLYREPTMPLRKKSWFAAVKLEFGWSELCPQLKFKLAMHAIAFSVKRMGVGEWKGDAA